MKQPRDLNIINLSWEHWEFKNVQERFLRTMTDTVEIKWIHKVGNEELLNTYKSKKWRMSRNGPENELDLFHGSISFVEICKSEDGFDMRLAKDGMWGRANYFAEKAQYSHRYSFRDDATGCYVMILAKVLTGNSVFSEPDNKLKRPPELPESGNSRVKKRYDSINGIANDTKVFMTYSNDQSYPAYLICYKLAQQNVAAAAAMVYKDPLLVAGQEDDGVLLHKRRSKKHPCASCLCRVCIVSICCVFVVLFFTALVAVIVVVKFK